jgi:hypothetical protein
MLVAAALQRLAHEFSHVSASELNEIVSRVHAGFIQAPVRDFVPLLVEKRAREEASQIMRATA